MKLTPSYRVLEEHGPDHQKEFLVGVFRRGDDREGPGETPNRRASTPFTENALVYVKEKLGWIIS